MTAATPNPRKAPAKTTVTDLDAAKKRLADKAANKEVLVAAKKVKEALEPTPPAKAKKAPAKKAPAKKTAPKAEKPAVQRGESTVGPMPKPRKLQWTEKDGAHLAVSGRWTYRVTEGDKGWFAGGKTGSWVPLHGDPQPTVEDAKLIAETVDAGAHWVVWAKYRVLPWAEIQKVATEADG